MSLVRIQGKAERIEGVYYEFDSEDIPLGEGGMGKVYKGRCVDEKSGSARAVAIKFMYSDLPPYAIEKARREAAIQFRHDNLIEMLGFIETETRSVLGEVQYHYHVVSELLEGVSLDKLLEGKLTDQRGAYVPYAEKLFKSYKQDEDGSRFAVDIVKSILSGLMSMHDAGYIHRDIDPTNIMITSDGRIKLIDFGIAKKMNLLTTNDKHLTQAGQFVGKPEYAAPELVLGAIHEQNQTTDIYAVGILLFQLIVGHTPFEGDRSDILQKQLHSKLPLNLIKHRGLRKIIAKATEKSRANRYQSAAEFRVALDQIKTGGNGKSKLPYYLSAAAGVAAVAIMVALVWAKPASEPTPRPHIDKKTTPAVTLPTYASVVEELKNTETAVEGFSNLEKLANNNDPQAVYLLSRLYFKSKIRESEVKNAGEIRPDSIREMQSRLSIQPDNVKAHELLKRAVALNPENYQAKYELACDYWLAEQRTEAVVLRDDQKYNYELRTKARPLCEEALEQAENKGDFIYERAAKGLLTKLSKFKRPKN